MQALLQYIDDMILEKQLYYRVWDVYKCQEFELQWLREQGVREPGKKGQWRLRPVDTEVWQYWRSSDLVSGLNEQRIALEQVEGYLRHSILQQVVFCHMQTQRAEKLFGAEALQEAIAANDRFMEALGQTIKSLLNKEEGALHLGQSSAQEAQSHLRLVDIKN